MARLPLSSLVAFLALSRLLPGDVTVGGDRPVVVHVPPSYDPAVPAPLLLGIHGWTGSPDGFEAYMQLGPAADARGFLYARPAATRNQDGNTFWNATDACCDFYLSGVDDSGYLRRVIDETRELLNVDERRIFVAGHSNGGFMAYRLACDHADVVAAVVSLAGAAYVDPADCRPQGPVHVLQIHGTADEVVSYWGGNFWPQNPQWGSYPGAVESVTQWAAHNRCPLEARAGPRLDLDRGLAGAETAVTRYTDGCAAGGSAELWTIGGGRHSPNIGPEFAEQVADWLLRHPKGVPTAASFTLEPTRGYAPLAVAANASGSTSLEGAEITAYAWDFGAGSTAGSPLASHTFETPGRYMVSLTIHTSDGLADSVEQGVSVGCTPGDLSPWRSAEIGEPAYPGSGRFEAGKTDGEAEALRLCAGGNLISTGADQCFLVYQELSGDFVMTARVADLSGGGAAGLMLRETLEPDARSGAMLLEVTLLEAGRFSFRWRAAAGSRASFKRGEAVEALAGWVRLERHGDLLRGSRSLDGESWTLLREESIEGLSEAVMAGVVAAGRDVLPEPLQATVTGLEVAPVLTFLRGDCDGDGELPGAVTDAVANFRHCFLGADVPCRAACDADGDGNPCTGVTDGLRILLYLFRGGDPLPAPFPGCGGSSRFEDVELGCETAPTCP